MRVWLVLRRKGGLAVLLGCAVTLFCLHTLYQDSGVIDMRDRRPRTGAGVIGVVASGWGGAAAPPGGHKEPPLPGPRQATPAARAGGVSGAAPPRESRLNQSLLYIAEKLSVPEYKVVNGTRRAVPFWQRKLQQYGRLGRMITPTNSSQGDEYESYFLAELLQVRIYEDDKAKWTIRELKQWIHFVLLAGVEHIYLCDHYKYETERLDGPLQRYIDLGLITYMAWSDIRHPMTAQIKCYQHIINEYKTRTRWQVAIDMDEYPFSPSDVTEGFLARAIRNVTAKHGSRVTEVSMANYLMLGQGDRNRDVTIDRVTRMTPKPANVLVKPIYRPENVRANIHHNHILNGVHMDADPDDLRMLHYWGARLQDWGPDTPHVISTTMEMNAMREAWADRLRNSLLVFGEIDAFATSTGP